MAMCAVSQRSDPLVNPGVVKLQDREKRMPSGGLNLFDTVTKKNP